MTQGKSKRKGPELVRKGTAGRRRGAWRIRGDAPDVVWTSDGRTLLDADDPGRVVADTDVGAAGGQTAGYDQVVDQSFPASDPPPVP